MSKNRPDQKQARRERAKASVQRFNWRTLSTHAEFADADKARKAAKKEAKHVKIRQRADGFRVVAGLPVKQEKAKPEQD